MDINTITQVLRNLVEFSVDEALAFIVEALEDDNNTDTVVTKLRIEMIIILLKMNKLEEALVQLKLIPQNGLMNGNTSNRIFSCIETKMEARILLSEAFLKESHKWDESFTTQVIAVRDDALEQVAQSSIDDPSILEDMKKMERLVNLVRKEGGQFNKVNIRYMSKVHRGIYSTEDIKV